jgi:hypothetical protein
MCLDVQSVGAGDALFFWSRWITSLSYVHLAALTGDGIHACSAQPQISLHRTEEAGDLPWRQANTLDVVLGQHSAEAAETAVVWTYGRRATEAGLSLGLEVLTYGFRASCISLWLYTFSLNLVLKELQLTFKENNNPIVKTT